MLQAQNIKAEQRFLERAEQNQKKLAAASILDANLQSEENAEDRRVLRQLALEKRERDMEESIMKVSAKTLDMLSSAVTVPCLELKL